MTATYYTVIDQFDDGDVQAAVYNDRCGEVARFRPQRTWEAAIALAQNWIRRQRILDAVLDGVMNDLRSSYGN